MARLKAGIIAAAIALGGIAAANGVAYAATGHGFILGVANTASTTTTLTRTTAGVPLALNARTGSAPLAVNSTTKVPGLNADMVDGLHASSLLLHPIKYALPQTAATKTTVTLPGLTHGIYLASYTVWLYSGTLNDRVDCAFEDTVHHFTQAPAEVVFSGHIGLAVGSGVLDARQGTFVFNCGGGTGPVNILADGYSGLFLTKVPTLTEVNAVQAP